MNDLSKRPDHDPPYDYPPYGSTRLRFPREPLVQLPAGALDVPGPLVPKGFVRDGDNDLTNKGKSAPLGEKMILAGRLLDESGRPIRDSLVEIWQANASGRYDHVGDQHDAPLDPNFSGAGRVLTDALGRYRFVTIRPGAYPWQNHPNAWRPAHIHFSVFGPAFATRLVTQMYFPGDPLLPHDPIFNCTADPRARQRLVSEFDFESTVEGHALGFRFDVVLSGPEATPMEAPAG